MTPLLEKFTKAKVFDFLKEFATTLDLNDADKASFNTMVEENFKPQAGGGASKNPSYLDEETGIMMHYCRFKQTYMPESEMNMFNGKSKGASKLAALHDYQIGKKIAELKDKAYKLFMAQDFTGGAEVNVDAETLEESRKNPETYSDENVAYLIKEDAQTNPADDSSAQEEV